MSAAKPTAKRAAPRRASPAASNATKPLCNECRELCCVDRREVRCVEYRALRTAIRTSGIAGWSAGTLLAAVTHAPLLPSVGAGVVAGIAAGATYPLLARVLAVRASR